MRESLFAKRKQLGEQIGGERGDGADGDFALQRRAVVDLAGGVVDFEEDPAGAFEEDGAGLGEHGFAAESVEEFMP